MPVRIYSVFLLFCVQVGALRRADPPSKESYRLCKKDQEFEKAAKSQQRAVNKYYIDLHFCCCYKQLCTAGLFL
jgi:hypothetical protein